jgi:uncharacterized protein
VGCCWLVRSFGWSGLDRSLVGRQLGLPVGGRGASGGMRGFFPFDFAQGQNDNKEKTTTRTNECKSRFPAGDKDYGQRRQRPKQRQRIYGRLVWVGERVIGLTGRGVEWPSMNRIARCLFLVLLLVAPGVAVQGQTVATLPPPTGYVNDFAGVLSPPVKQSVEDLCAQVDRKAHAQIAVVTIKRIEDDSSIEEFATALEEKWKVGNKDDRGVLMLLVMTPRRGRIEVGYGLEGILNDAKVGDIGRSMVPAASQGDYDTAIPLGVRQIADVIAKDAGVTLTGAQPMHSYHREPVRQPVQLSLFQIVLGGGAILLVLFFLVKTGNVGIIFFLLGNLMGGGGGGGYRGGRDRDDGGSGGGFGGFGGGSSGGGGASGDF